jgi:hypothetical protein
MMQTFTAGKGTQFFYDPALRGELWIVTVDNPPLTVMIPAIDLVEFSVTRINIGAATAGAPDDLEKGGKPCPR